MRKGITHSSIPPIQHGTETIYSNLRKADIFDEYFINQTLLDNPEDNVPLITPNVQSIPPLVITPIMVHSVLENLDPKKLWAQMESTTKFLKLLLT